MAHPGDVVTFWFWSVLRYEYGEVLFALVPSQSQRALSAAGVL